ncbi:unnamed protein product [Calypogeia fissa]
MESPTLADVNRAIANFETATFRPLPAWLVNFEALNEFPRKFYYRGCTRTSTSGRACTKTVEGLFACPHSSSKDSSSVEMYRFDVFLVDTSIASDAHPIKATIFQFAKELTGLSAQDFSLKGDFEQYALVHAVTTRMHEVEVILRVKEHQGAMQCTIQSLSLLGDDECELLHSTPCRSAARGPASPSTYYTPSPGIFLYWEDDGCKAAEKAALLPDQLQLPHR